MSVPRPKAPVCELIGLHEAWGACVQQTGRTQSATHIKPMHWYVACRLVVEGGFDPRVVTPRPPFEVKRRGGAMYLEYAPALATGSEATVFGGLKTKDVDV